jgi:hypothetical protein
MRTEDKRSDDLGATVSAGVGAAAGTSGAIAAVAAGGPVFGLGAAGITSGLAAVGSIVGGGMAAGLCIVAAAPILAGAAAFGGYKLYRHLDL